MKTSGWVGALLLLVLLAGCAVPRPDVSPRPSRNTAVVALLDQARSQSLAGQLEAAGSSLERALRIEPRNPVLWQKLARLRLEQGDHRQAEQLARKSNAFAGGDRRLRAENWRLIGEARRGLGDERGARAAFDKARSVR